MKCLRFEHTFALMHYKRSINTFKLSVNAEMQIHFKWGVNVFTKCMFYDIHVLPATLLLMLCIKPHLRCINTFSIIFTLPLQWFSTYVRSLCSGTPQRMPCIVKVTQCGVHVTIESTCTPVFKTCQFALSIFVLYSSNTETFREGVGANAPCPPK